MNISFHTFGCKTNVCDSEEIASKLPLNFNINENLLDADVHVINTCTVTNSSDSQARNLINKIEKINNGSLIIITGCSVRNNDYKDFVSKLLKNKYLILDNFKSDVSSSILNYYKLEPVLKNNLKFRSRAYIKVGDGCNNFCSYCIIPYVRGRLINRAVSSIIEEIKTLEDSGVKELVLTAICLDAYEYGLLNLLETILKNTKDIRIRLSSLRPSSVNENLIKLFTEHRLRPHFHISLQSGSNNILKLMNRHDYKSDTFINSTLMIKDILKDRSPFVGADIIVGFPGEGEAEFKETLDTLEKSYFTNLHVFKFSPRKRTEAYELNKNYKSINLKERSTVLLDIASKNYQKGLKSMLGKNCEVLWETSSSAYTENYFPVKGSGKKNLIEVLTIKEIEKNKLLV